MTLRQHVALALAFRQGGRAHERDTRRADWIAGLARHLVTFDDEEIGQWWRALIDPQTREVPS